MVSEGSTLPHCRFLRELATSPPHHLTTSPPHPVKIKGVVAENIYVMSESRGGKVEVGGLTESGFKTSEDLAVANPPKPSRHEQVLQALY